MSSHIRVRFAPSPTGPLHIGGVRTALFNYLFARKAGGKFLVRIEDTDQNRYVSGAEEYIKQSLEWVGLKTDEDPWQGGPFGPYRQSDRKGMYRQYAQQLLDSGHAYVAFDTPEELEQMRERLKNAKVPNPQYNAAIRGSMRNSLTLSADETKARIESGDAYVFRVKIPRNEEVRFYDMIRGWVHVSTNTLDDKVIFKSDGMPTYHLANIVDDHLMKISHVIRGEEWLPSAPLHMMLYSFLGWEDSRPEFAHLPLILRPDGNGKLSKRDGDRLGFPVFPLEWKDPETGEISSGYREKGYYPEAFINMLALLGWNPGTAQEIFSMDELIQAFSIDRVGKSGSKFDADKTKWFNQHYLRSKPESDLINALKPILDQKGIKYVPEKLAEYIELMKDRAVFVADMAEGRYLFEAPTAYDQNIISKKWNDQSEGHITALIDLFSGISFDHKSLTEAFNGFLAERQLNTGTILPLLRVFISGVSTGPGVFEMMGFIGKKDSIERLETGVKQMVNA